MARHLVSLSWRSIAQSFSRRGQVRSSAWLALILLAVGVAIVVATLVLLDEVPLATDQLLRGLLVGALGIGCFATGAITHAGDPLDERAVALTGKSAASATVGTLLASAFTPAPLVILALAAVVVTMSVESAVSWLSLVATVLIWLTWLFLARLGVRAGRGLSGHRWGREVGRLAGYCVLLVFAPLVYALIFLPWREALEVGGQAVTGAMEWLPPASMLMIGAAEDPLTPVLSSLALVLVLFILEVSFGVYAARRAMRDVTPGGSTRLGVFRSAAGSGTRAVAARIGLAWLRDGRYGVVLSTVILLPMLFVIPIAIGGLPLEWLSLLPVPVFAFLLGWALHNDTAYDSTALWLHVTSGMRGIVDRLGRSIPVLIFGTVVLVIGAGVTTWFSGSGIGGLVVLGTGLALLGSSVGGSAIMSAWRPYPVARPGDSPFSQPLRSWGDALVMHPLAGFIEIVLCGHVIWLAITTITAGSWAFAWATLSIGVATGALLCLVGMFLGGAVFGKRSWKLLEFAQSY
ncbi:hypothetical protein [Gulosibacter chungangensis]|uniref:Uncharacterized protein n=1 Tax=Gulosibacter chungangensis TaxID=979746 RepID=A0A7J5BBK2_9MICO|nr:hypothetical protein [Gulosibacter chungangensis]KAB1643494.1 hypothetical protein F8O05_06295 [Gulosibacter chungangensis]